MKTTNDATDDRDWAATYAWLISANARTGSRRIERLSWKRLTQIHDDAPDGSEVRKVIEAEAKRCGYTPANILAIHRR